MEKYDIVNGLGRAAGLGRYLEICTPSTGVKFGFVDREMFEVAHRLMYNCPEDFEDGLEISFRTASLQSKDIVRTMLALLPADRRYDLVFVDPYHTFEASIADMHGALCLLRPGGVLVVHDCNPSNPDTVGSDFRDGAWCGVTYEAFIDFVLSTQPAGYCVVDCDYGCGVVFSEGRPLPRGLRLARPDQRTIYEWTIARGNDATRYPFFDAHRRKLLNLVAPASFGAACGIEVSEASDDPTHSAFPESPNTRLGVRAFGQDVPMRDYKAGWHAYEIPAGAQSLDIVSDTFVPSETDHRKLGVSVAGIRLDGVAIDLADPCLTKGWYSDEAGTGYPWRWTGGVATMELLDGGTILEISTNH